MSAPNTQAQPVRRRKNPGRIWLRVSVLEATAVRVVARRKGMNRTELLRRFSLNDVVTQHRQPDPEA